MILLMTMTMTILSILKLISHDDQDGGDDDDDLHLNNTVHMNE